MKHISRTAAFLFIATFNSVLAAGAPEPDSVQLVVGNEVLGCKFLLKHSVRSVGV